MAPENVVEVPSPPVVRVAEPSVALPAPASDPMLWLKLFRSSVAPAATLKALAGAKVLTAPARSVPAVIVVAPL